MTFRLRGERMWSTNGDVEAGHHFHLLFFAVRRFGFEKLLFQLLLRLLPLRRGKHKQREGERCCRATDETGDVRLPSAACVTAGSSCLCGAWPSWWASCPSGPSSPTLPGFARLAASAAPVHIQNMTPVKIKGLLFPSTYCSNVDFCVGVPPPWV